jgi:hypothetical protein
MKGAIISLVLLFALVSRAGAQPRAVNDASRATEIGIVQEWFHRELEPSIYEDTRWSTTSIVLTYNITDWLNIGLEGGTSEFESDEFPGSSYNRYTVGGTAGARVVHFGAWNITANARYLDTFDLDESRQLMFHKRVRSASGSVNVLRSFAVLSQSATLWAGPTVVNDFVQTFAYDSTTPLESSSGTALGAGVGGRLILGGWVSLYGFASYVDDVQGGFGACLHAKDGSF